MLFLVIEQSYNIYHAK
ncbi:hypothetical protein RUM_06000 [Ruminococcus champanellensis 18P13 = JCM 17042]|uniref:Uncharacterized protein n=1 Tax=Ruminococcus champanellensis (strain DSM 18848 / JCM 17042 / KCTC 15320 / 18P13) TaxID=213810 RepID=D4LB22_RUMC1|nr:hypothetical protein RUM_06000 [Ruminococcus champanellensis 18P13 = JCM 17042]